MKKNLTSLIATIISLLLIVAGTVGLILLQKPLREESQDIRKDASVESGKVIVSGLPNSGNTFTAGEEATISFQANTKGAQTDGIQLVFNLITNTLGSTPTISIPSGSGLQAAYQQIEQTGDGYLISLIALPQQIGQAFSSTTPVTIAQLEINPSNAGNIELSFDREKSKSIIQGTNPPQDALKYVNSLTYTVTNSSGDPIPSPSPSPSPSPATGGLTVQGCNLACTSNAECETDHRCYNGQCRLVTNVSSTTCEPKPDQGLDFGCNSYCADSRECDSQYACLENKCRRADNPDDASCRIPSSTIQKNVDESCNTTCGTNADCAANLRCYYGACRLATNVSSTTCTAATTKSVSTLYTKSDTPKGGDLEGQDATDSTVPAAIISRPSPSPSALTKPEVEEETALDAVIESARKAGVPINLLPFIALGAGVLLLLLVIIPKLFGNKNRRSPVTDPQQKINQESSKYEQELQAKLDELKQQPPTPPTAMSKPQAPTPTGQPPIPPMSASKPSTPPRSTMMERVKEKGVTPPKS